MDKIQQDWKNSLDYQAKKLNVIRPTINKIPTTQSFNGIGSQPKPLDDIGGNSGGGGGGGGNGSWGPAANGSIGGQGNFMGR
jgi:hypothetical protein